MLGIDDLLAGKSQNGTFDPGGDRRTAEVVTLSGMGEGAETEMLVRRYWTRRNYERDAGRMIHRGWSVAREREHPRLGILGRFLRLKPGFEITYCRSWESPAAE